MRACHPAYEPSSVKEYNGYYISYNTYDINIYGSITTALVKGQMEKFFILDGDHRNQYDLLKDKGFSACLEYFNNNISLKNKHSN